MVKKKSFHKTVSGRVNHSQMLENNNDVYRAKKRVKPNHLEDHPELWKH